MIGATVDAVETISTVMKKKIKAVVILPHAYADIKLCRWFICCTDMVASIRIDKQSARLKRIMR